jgi:hypothetical protein
MQAPRAYNNNVINSDPKNLPKHRQVAGNVS